jgi:hypothetical protein
MTQFYATISKSLKQVVFDTAMKFIRSTDTGMKEPDEPHVVQLAPLIAGFREVEVDYSGGMKDGLVECKWILDAVSEMGMLFEGVHDAGRDRALWVPWGSVVGLRFMYRDEGFIDDALKGPVDPQEEPAPPKMESPKYEPWVLPVVRKGPSSRRPGDYLDIDAGEGDS